MASEAVNDNVIIKPTPINLEDDLTSKLQEIRSKRDAVSLNHEDIKNSNDKYNKVIIVLSLFTAFVESLKTQLGLATSSNKVVANLSALAPIALSTCVAIISSLLKFKKFPEKMEELTKASEKCSYSITRIRELKQILNFEDPPLVKNSYVNQVLEVYRESLSTVENSLYPDVRQHYFKKAQKNLISISKDAQDYTDEINSIKIKKDFLPIKKEPELNYKEFKRRKTPYPKMELDESIYGSIDVPTEIKEDIA
tara:strand:- start:8814 stop:9572 length:759 start_codon:yes stop_codon:yes gene_type:complete